MSVSLAKAAIKDLISDNAVTLCTSLTHQGQQRQISMLSTSRLSPMPGHYSVYVSSPTSGYGKVATRTTRAGHGQKGRRIDMVVEIYDEAVMQFNDDQPFESINADFDLLVDRLAYLIESTGQFTFSDGNKALLLDDGELNAIERTDLSGQWLEDDDSVGRWLVAQLRFSLRCNCVSDLY